MRAGKKASRPGCGRYIKFLRSVNKIKRDIIKSMLLAAAPLDCLQPMFVNEQHLDIKFYCCLHKKCNFRELMMMIIGERREINLFESSNP